MSNPLSTPASAISIELPPDCNIKPLLDRSRNGDLTVLPELKAALQDRPEIWSACGDIVHHAEQAVLTLVAGKDVLLREAVVSRLKAMKAELVGPVPTPLERLLVDRVGLDWLLVYTADLAALQTTPADEFIPLGADFRERKRDLAHRRFLRSLKILSDVRRLLRPQVAPLDVTRLTETGPPAPRPLPWSGSRRRPIKATASDGK